MQDKTNKSVATIHNIKYSKVTDRHKHYVIGKWDSRFKAFYSQQCNNNNNNNNNRMNNKKKNIHPQKALGISKISMLEQYGREDFVNNNMNLIDTIFTSSRPNSAAKSSHLFLKSSKLQTSSTASSTSPRTRNIILSMSKTKGKSKRKGMRKKKRKKRIKSSQRNNPYCYNIFKPKLKIKTRNILFDQDDMKEKKEKKMSNLKWVNTVDYHNDKMELMRDIDEYVQLNSSFDGKKLNDINMIMENYKQNVLNFNSDKDIYDEEKLWNQICLAPSSSSIHSSIIRKKRRPASAGTRSSTKNNQQYYGRSNRRPASANSNRQRRKVQPHPPSNIITGSINYKKYNRPVKKLISKLQEYQYLPSSKSNNLRNSNVLIGRTDRNSTINYDDAVLCNVHVNDRIVLRATKMAYDRRMKTEIENDNMMDLLKL